VPRECVTPVQGPRNYLAHARESAMAAHVAEPERCVYDAKTMSTVVDGDDADAFLLDKLCEQGLKGECAPSTAASAPAHVILAAFSSPVWPLVSRVFAQKCPGAGVRTHTHPPHPPLTPPWPDVTPLAVD